MKSDRQQLWWPRRPAQAFLCWVSWMRRRLEHYSEQQAVLAQREARGVLRFFLLLGNFPAFHHVKVGAKSPTFPTLFGPTLIHQQTPTSVDKTSRFAEVLPSILESNSKGEKKPSQRFATWFGCQRLVGFVFFSPPNLLHQIEDFPGWFTYKITHFERKMMIFSMIAICSMLILQGCISWAITSLYLGGPKM